MLCEACGKGLEVGEEFLQCAAEACGKLYHHLCNNRTVDLDKRDT